ncbi:MAG: hypothetical protein M1833_000790 [Piccolia ochrophora]|nr:MAG: hypothetical protein M1833_000790 [Piccolia ochrophora]
MHFSQSFACLGTAAGLVGSSLGSVLPRDFPPTLDPDRPQILLDRAWIDWEKTKDSKDPPKMTAGIIFVGNRPGNIPVTCEAVFNEAQEADLICTNPDFSATVKSNDLRFIIGQVAFYVVDRTGQFLDSTNAERDVIDEDEWECVLTPLDLPDRVESCYLHSKQPHPTPNPLDPIPMEIGHRPLDPFIL